MKRILLLISILLFSSPNFALTYAKYGDYAQFTNTSVLLVSNILEERYDLLTPQALSYATAMGTMFTLKNILHTTRPNGGQHSFPSGHTTSAFMGVYPLYKKYGLKVGIPAFLIATSVAHSRVQENYHYTRDVIAGALIALTSDYLFFKSKLNTKVTISIGLNSFLLSYRY